MGRRTRLRSVNRPAHTAAKQVDIPTSPGVRCSSDAKQPLAIGHRTILGLSALSSVEGRPYVCFMRQKVVYFVIVSGLLVVGCRAAEVSPTTAPTLPAIAAVAVEGDVLDISLVDALLFEPAFFAVDAPGTYSVTFVNDGFLTHDLAIPGLDPITLAAGETITERVQVGPEGLSFFCSTPGHFEGGMVGGVVVGSSPVEGLAPITLEDVEAAKIELAAHKADHDEMAEMDHEMAEMDHEMAEMDHEMAESAIEQDEAAQAHDGEEISADEQIVFVDRQIEVSMNEYSFEPESVAVEAGETIEFLLVNNGVLPHEFRLTNDHSIAEHLASGHADHGAESEDHHAAPVIEVPAGESASLVVTFEQDLEFDTIACLLPGHYELGMHGSLAVS